jgi:hypothetical protein
LIAAVIALLSMLSATSYGADTGWCEAFSGAAPVFFDGTLRQGESFQRIISGNLAFRLAPVDRGWNIIVTESSRPENFAAVVQTPLRFNYTLEIMPWHFGRGQGTPGTERGFDFVLSMEDYQPY